ncbi:hypothetical protein WAI453_003600 [Rhynchosporium graminicola]
MRGSRFILLYIGRLSEIKIRWIHGHVGQDPAAEPPLLASFCYLKLGKTTDRFGKGYHCLVSGSAIS